MMETLHLVFKTYICILTIGCLLSIHLKSSDIHVNLIRLVLVFTFFIEVVSFIVMHFYENNLFIQSLWLLIVPTIFIYNLSYQNILFKKRWEFILSGIYLVFTVFNFFFFQGLYTFNTYSSHLGALMVLTLVFFKLKEYFDNPSLNIIRDPLFYIITALFFFYVGGFLVNVAINYLIEINIAIAGQIIIIRNIVNCMTYSLFSMALLIDYSNRKKMSLTSAT